MSAKWQISYKMVNAIDTSAISRQTKVQQLKKIADLAEDFGKLVKFSALISTILGTYYLISYTARHKLPLPLDLSTLSVVLLLIGTITVFISALLVIYFLFVLLLNFKPYKFYYSVLIHTNCKGVVKEYESRRNCTPTKRVATESSKKRAHHLRL